MADLNWLPHREYHCRMMLNTLKHRIKPAGDTRAYLDVDDADAEILIEILEKELNNGRS